MQNWAQRGGINGTDADFQVKKVPGSVLVFGASGHIGGPVAFHLAQTAPHIKLRLLSSSPVKADRLRTEFPDAEVVVADFNDVTTLIPAFEGIEGAFVVTSDLIDPKLVTLNITTAAKKAETLSHIVRVQGEFPQILAASDCPPQPELHSWWAIEHIWAREIYAASGLPVTFLNSAAVFYDNFLAPGLFGPGIVNSRTLAIPFNKIYTYIDTRDIGVAGANLLLSDDIRNVGMTYHLDNGIDYMDHHETAELMSRVLGVQITSDDSFEAYKRENGEIVRALAPEGEDADAWIDVVANYLKWEQQVSKGLCPSYRLEYLLGRKPVSFPEWLEEYADMLLGRAPAEFPRRYPTPRPATIHAREDGLSRQAAMV